MTLLAGVAAALAGFLLYMAHPPLDQGWAGILALAPLMTALRHAARARRPTRSGAVLGLIAGVVFFGLLLTWIARFGVLAWVLLVGVEALFIAIFGAVVAAWGERRGRAVVAVVAWAGIEVVRSRFPLGGFAWGVLGLSQHGGGPLLPAARIGGVLLVGILAASIAVALEVIVFTAWRAVPARRRGVRLPRSWRRAGVLAAGHLVLLAVVLPLAPAAPEASEDSIDIAAVQGNDIELPPAVDRLNRVRIERVVERMTAATRELVDPPAPDLVVWPENSLDNDYREDPRLSELVTEAKESIGGAPLVAGTLLDGPRAGTAYNTLVVIGADQEITQTYRKRKLVPFGEYVPARRWLDWFPPLEQIPIDYLPGQGPDLFTVDGVAVGPVTCFESIFPQIVHDQVRAGAEVLVVSTNNASFGRTAASRQHLAFSQLRAVETGRWVVHAGISGISGIVDPNGEISQRTELFEQVVVRDDVPLVSGNTMAMWFQPWLARGAVAGLLVVLVLLAVRRPRDPDPEEPASAPVLVEANAGDG